MPKLPTIAISIPKPVLLAGEALAAGAVAAGLDAMSVHLTTASALPSVQTMAGWFAAGAVAWAGANLRKTYAGLLASETPATPAAPTPAPKA